MMYQLLTGSLPFYADIARVQAMGGGMTLPIVASSIFALSLLIPARRWRQDRSTTPTAT